MKRLLIAALTLPLAGAAAAQSTDVSTYLDVSNLGVTGADGRRIGEIETVLVDGAGNPVAFTVEIDDDFLDLDDSEVVMQIDALTWENGGYTTDMTSADVEGLPVWDD